MTRLIRHDATGPASIEIGETTVAICQCGLSENKPFCDGSHAKTRGEEPGKLYIYDESRHRVDLVDMFPTPTRKFAGGK
ncbi:MAG: CDGSH iron-sulfur domain-containing protein [Thermoplasmata archaeon]